MGGMLGGNAPRQFGYDGVSPLMDMINGGGAGRAGQRFEGGGLLSDIGNAMFRPYGFEERMGQVRPQARPMRPPMAPPAPAVDIHAVPPAPLTYGPQNPRRTPQPLTYGPQNGRPAVRPMTEAELFEMFMNAPPEQQAQIYRDLIAPRRVGY